MATESFFSNASLAYLASAGAGKDGKTYSIKPTDGSGDFTFSRGSNLAATRVGPTGLIEKGRENLLLQSNTFSNASWLKELGTTLTSGQSGYDGSSDAWLLDTDGTQFSRLRQTLSSNGVQTFSIYAKAGTLDWIGLYNGGASGNAFFDLNNGVTGNSNAIIDTSITSVGNGWYRCEYSSNQSITDVRIYLTDANGTFTTTAGNIYIQDAQLEIGLAATEVITTGATTGKAGLLEDEPRFDYSGGATCPSLLLEPSRTNLIGYSEYINESVASWSRFFSTIITNNDAISPDGKNNATKIECPIGQSARVDAIVSGLSAGTYTYSFYAKGNVSNLDVNIYQNATGDTLSSTAIETLINDSEWSRVDITFTSTASSTIRCIYANLTAGEYFYMWGAQLEQASYPTSYIPNHSGGSVTRGADGISKDLTSVVNGNQMTMFLDLKSHISIGTQTNALWGDLRWYHKSNNRILFYKNDDAINIGGDITINGRTKIALSITTTDAKVFVNGSQVYTTSLPTPFVDFGELIYEILNSKEEWNQFLIFSTPLSDADCITLTTL
jgi:hypothetical protein